MKVKLLMKLFNTLTRQVESFKPLVDKKVGIYSCGPTVYDRAHLGNWRTYILADLVVRTLRLLGFEVFHVMNVTDIDDKMIERAHREKISLSELAERYETIFFSDLAKLNIELADIYPRATEHFSEMKQLLNQLVEKGVAYEKDGSVYFSISKFSEYGRLSHLEKRQLKPGARVATDEYSKENVNDFALWKQDRPGWHLECSAMSMRYLGPTIDIHLGGVDLIFPHHENEIAQSQAATGKPFVRHWVHGEHILIDGQKMAKSANNFYSVADIEKEGLDPLAYRYLVLMTHYRQKLNFSWTSLQAAAKTLNGIRELAWRPFEHNAKQKKTILEQGMAALTDDLDTPKLLALLHQANNYDLWLAFEPVLGLGLASTNDSLPESVKQLAKERWQVKNAGHYDQADLLRKQIELAGYRIEDQSDGWRLIPRTLDKD